APRGRCNLRGTGRPASARGCHQNPPGRPRTARGHAFPGREGLRLCVLPCGRCWSARGAALVRAVLDALRSPAFRAIFMVAAIAAAIWAVIGNWDEVSAALSRLDWWIVVLSLVVSIIFVILTMLAWRVILNDAGEPVGKGPARRIFYVSQVAKYLP